MVWRFTCHLSIPVSWRKVQIFSGGSSQRSRVFALAFIHSCFKSLYLSGKPERMLRDRQRAENSVDGRNPCPDGTHVLGWEVDYKQMSNCDAWMSGGDECCGRRWSGRESEWLRRNCDLKEGGQGNSSHGSRPGSCVTVTKLNQSPACKANASLLSQRSFLKSARGPDFISQFWPTSPWPSFIFVLVSG